MALNLSDAKPLSLEGVPAFVDTLAKGHPRSAPRFYESPLRILHQPHVFLLKEFENCVCVLKKRQIMGNPVAYLIIPPVSMSGHAGDAGYVVDRFAENNVNALLTEEDLDYMGIHPSDYIPDGKNREYCYTLETLGDRQGVNKKKYRRPLNAIARAESLGTTQVHTYSSQVPPHVIDAASRLTSRWLKQRGKSAYRQTFFVEMFNAVANVRKPGSMAMTVIMHDGRCLGYLIAERVPNGIINNTACVEYDDNPVMEPTLVLLQRNAAWWLNHGLPKKTMVNRGAAVRGTGSVFAKEKMHPDAVIQNMKHRDLKLSKQGFIALWEAPQHEPEWL